MVSFLPTQKLSLNLNGSYVDAKGSMEMGEMPDVPQEVTDNIAAADYDFSSMDQYSDLAYTQFNVSVGAEYAISPRVALTADAAYLDLTDDKGYVYGVESGSMFVVRSGVRVGF